jgi:hypothetical protein
MSGLRKKLKKMIILWTFTSRDLKAVPEETKVPNQQFTNFYEVFYLETTCKSFISF